MNKNTSVSEFTGLRALLWPIHNYELKKFLPMGLMMFCALFNYTIVRDLKDAMIVKGIGAETISFIKFWVVMPSSILFVIAYNKMSNALSRNMLFLAAIVPFLVFFGAFGFYLYPNRDTILPDAATVQAMIENVPFSFLVWFVKMYSKWILVVFYMLAELWGSIVISLVFWQFANGITRVFEAKRFYAMFGFIGNFGLILSGQTLVYFAEQAEKTAGAGADPFEASLKPITAAFVIFGLLFIYLHNWTNKNVMSDPRLYDPNEKKTQKEKLKLGMWESMKLIFTSKYLAMIFVIVIGYGMSINLVEVTWKQMIGMQFTSENEYTAFMGQFSTYTGMATILFMLIGQNIVRIFGWRISALLTPIMILVTGGIFFVSVVYRETLVTGILMGVITNPVLLAVWIGQIQNVLSKATKYSLFDPTKEMSYIPLDPELKVKGKAAVDVIGGRLGKSGGSIIQQLLIVGLVSAGDKNAQLIIAPYLFAFLLVVVILWIFAVNGLGRAFSKLTEKKEHIQP